MPLELAARVPFQAHYGPAQIIVYNRDLLQCEVGKARTERFAKGFFCGKASSQGKGSALFAKARGLDLGWMEESL
jgi:hypothetical protein